MVSRVRLCDPMDCSLPGSSVHGIFQPRILEWGAIVFSRGSSWTQVSCIVGRCFTVWATREAQSHNSREVQNQAPQVQLKLLMGPHSFWDLFGSPCCLAFSSFWRFQLPLACDCNFHLFLCVCLCEYLCGCKSSFASLQRKLVNVFRTHQIIQKQLPSQNHQCHHISKDSSLKEAFTG